jgi:hypothetical protein
MAQKNGPGGLATPPTLQGKLFQRRNGPVRRTDNAPAQQTIGIWPGGGCA